MNAYKLALVATFGRISRNPLRTAYVRLTVVSIFAAGVGILLSRLAVPFPAVPYAGDLLSACLAAYTTQLAVLIALLASLGVISAKDRISQLLLVLPLTTGQRWCALMMPSLVITGIACLLILPTIADLLMGMGIHPGLLCISSSIGILAALGMIHGVPRRLAWVRTITIPLSVAGEYFLLQTLALKGPGASGIIAGMGLCLLLAIWCWRLFRQIPAIGQDISHTVATGRVLTITQSPRWWFVVKILRAGSTRLGYITTLAMSSGFALILKQYGFDAASYLVVAGFLVAAFASDIRSTCARDIPVEVAGLRGTARFASAYWAAALLCATTAALPLIIAAAVAGPIAELYQGMNNLLLGIGAGVFVGTILVPAPRDVLAQLCATLTSLAILFVGPRLPIVSSLPPEGLAGVNIALAALFILGSWGVEYHRNRYIWRKS